MDNYELAFTCATDTGAVCRFECVTAVPDLDTARLVAHAMVGERVDTDQTLDSVVHVIPSSRPAFVPRTPDGYYALWGRIFRALDIDIAAVRLWYGAEIGLGTNPTGHLIVPLANLGEPEIVGFRYWPVQQP